MRMKTAVNALTAVVTIVAVELQCPTCGTEVPSPGGSLFWDINEIGPQNAKKCFCPKCKQQLKFPKRF
jgi:Zn finger protein HypA/HybF involved in hydrogenase expression